MAGFQKDYRTLAELGTGDWMSDNSGIPGSGIVGRAVTATLYVSPNGDNSDGSTWDKAYRTIQGALSAASTDANECTAILIAPHATYYDINTTGDPTWTGNYEINGTHRIWAAIRNEHATATSVMKFTGKVSLRNLAIFTEDSVNGVIFTNSGWRVRCCGFNSSGTSGANASVYIDGTSGVTRGGIMDDIQFIGNVTHTKAIYINTSTINEFSNVRIHECLKGIHIVNTASDLNEFKSIDIGDSAIGIDIDAGNEQHFSNIQFHHNTVNVDDEVGDHIYDEMKGDFPITISPTNLAGITVIAFDAINTYGNDTEIIAAGAIDAPFRVVGFYAEPIVAQWYQVRFSWGAAGTAYFDQIMVKTARAAGSSYPAGTGFIFNKGTRISASAKALTAGNDEIQVWVKLQLI